MLARQSRMNEAEHKISTRKKCYAPIHGYILTASERSHGLSIALSSECCALYAYYACCITPFTLTTLTVKNHPNPCELIDAIQTSLAILPRSMRYGSIAIYHKHHNTHTKKLNTRHARVYTITHNTTACTVYCDRLSCHEKT